MRQENFISRFFCFLLVLPTISSCQENEMKNPKPAWEPVLPSRPYNYRNANDPGNAIATLGRVLFYEKALSETNTVSCGSCHKQALAFADNVALSAGIGHNVTARNALPIQNLLPDATLVPGNTTVTGYGAAGNNGTLGGLFWDGRAGNLNEMVLMPIQNPREMGSRLDMAKIAKLPYYKPLVMAAFNRGYIVDSDVSTALALFVSSIKNQNTKFDLRSGNPLNEQETMGFQLFTGKYNCNNCHHVEETSNANVRFANIGLKVYDDDRGLFTITGNESDQWKFKVPSLRNVEFTAPYMHDGSLATLEEVIQHYSDEIIDNPNLHDDLKDETGHARKMNISPDDVKALIAFLKTLSDKSILTDPKFSDPFKAN